MFSAYWGKVENPDDIMAPETDEWGRCLMRLDTCALLWRTLKAEVLTEEEKQIVFSVIENGHAAISLISI